MDRSLGGTFVSRWLRQCGASSAQLARSLGVSASQLNNWIHGRELIPSRYWPEIGGELGLTPTQMLDLVCIFEAAARVADLERLFDPGLEVQQKGRTTELAAYFTNPADIRGRLLRVIEKSVSLDISVLPHCTSAQLAQIHGDAAVRCCSDINKFLLARVDNVFTERNIEQHLRYPHHLYFAFFLTDVTQADGAQVPKLQASLYEALDACAALESSQNRVDRRIAQHALHVLARYRGYPITSYRRSRNPETQRMAFFGEVYRSFDTGPFEELADRIVNDGPFAEVTWAFDRLHYRDAGLGKEAQVTAPMNAMSRNIAALTDPRPSMRRVASARIINTIRHLPTSARFQPDFRARLVSERVRLESFRPSGPIEMKARTQLLSIGSSSENGETA
jgi:hypothetical protein